MRDVYMQKLVGNILNNYNVKDDNFVFIKHFSNVGIARVDIEDMLIKHKDVYLLYHQYDHNQVNDAYEPFLEWISDVYYNLYCNKMTVEEFIEHCNVYSLHKSIFVSYIKTGKCVRSDDVLICEISFEQMKFYNSLLNIFKYITRNNKLLFVLNNMHLAEFSSIAFIYKVLNLEEFIEQGWK